MLDELRVENLGIIGSVSIEPGPGLVAVTGETGTGKTLLLGALRLLRGDAASPDRIGPHGPESEVQGRFVVGDAEIVAARRVTATRSRAYLDGAMVPAKALADRFEGLIEIVAQHEHVTLGRESSLRSTVDGLLDGAGAELVVKYRDTWRRLFDLEKEAKSVGGDERLLARELDLLRHQAAEIEAAGLSIEEDDALAIMLRRLRHAGEISESVAAATNSLDLEDGAIDGMRAALDHIRTAAKLDPSLELLASGLGGVIAAAEEIVADLRHQSDVTEHEPGALATAEARGSVITDLKRKYGATITEVLEFGVTAGERAELIAKTMKRAETISADIAAARLEAIDAGRLLAAARRNAAERLTTDALELLRGLGFRDPFLDFEVEDSEPHAAGADRINLRFASDRALTPGPVAKVASGGELSRLVLAIRVAAGVADAPIIAFDEVDAGVGGATALAMGEQLAALAQHSQALVVTHLPQVAAFADRHFVVERDGAAATVRQVDGDDRLAELARMLGGMEESERGRLHAEELLTLAQSRRKQ